MSLPSLQPSLPGRLRASARIAGNGFPRDFFRTLATRTTYKEFSFLVQFLLTYITRVQSVQLKIVLVPDNEPSEWEYMQALVAANRNSGNSWTLPALKQLTITHSTIEVQDGYHLGSNPHREFSLLFATPKLEALHPDLIFSVDTIPASHLKALTLTFGRLEIDSFHQITASCRELGSFTFQSSERDEIHCDRTAPQLAYHDHTNEIWSFNENPIEIQKALEPLGSRLEHLDMSVGRDFASCEPYQLLSSLKWASNLTRLSLKGPKWVWTWKESHIGGPFGYLFDVLPGKLQE
ncbi:hypothetical protein C8034_v011936 [Colletotrichum sidae]|uniref:Uncharacterized protein n=1 Tax=Colletotrichum sidae TaxID=1347389 RepID=A0A4R8TJQ5_9PEZI|nr:hypothetical protein C8034_v011936 [Colletotrichum sidae]